MMTNAQLLELLARARTDEIVVTSMSTVRPWGRLSDGDLDFASADSAMGHTADLALGLALAQPDRKVICLNGDGSMMMTLGTLATIIESGVENLILFVIDNGTYEITGNQKVPGAGVVDWEALAVAAGFPRTYQFSDAAQYEATLGAILAGEGPVFVQVCVERGDARPISRSQIEEARYIQTSMADWSRRMRAALMEEIT
jgi:thiamine pyrophosphate-dependent acetolactate synthase large subunit-like protein